MTKAGPGIFIGLVIIFALIHAFEWQSMTPASPTEIGYLEDPGNGMDINQAASTQTSGRYDIKQDNRISLGFSRSALWLRIALDQAPKSENWALSIDAPWMEYIDFYLPDPEKGWRKLSTGLQQPNVSASVDGFTLITPAPASGSDFFYLRLKSVLALNAGLHLWSKNHFDRWSQTRAYIYGGLYGIMLAMLTFNLLVFLTLHDKAYLYYVFYLASIIIHQFCLQGQILTLPMDLWPMVPTLSLVISALVFFWGALFCRTFLNTKFNTPIIDRLLFGGQMAAVVLLALALTGRLWWGTWLTHSLAVIGPLAAIAAGVQARKKGYMPAGIYLLAWMVMLLGTMAWGAWSMGWLDTFRPPQMTLTVAAALESCLLTLAMAERVRVVHRERQVLAQREKRYHQLSITDELTKLYNHRYFWDKLSREIEQALHLGQPLSLLVMDLDDFKNINDIHGHYMGDQILAKVGHLLKSNLRPDDSAYRYGGEEFTLILPGADGHAAVEVAERVRRAVSQVVFQCQQDPPLTITASLGATQLLPGDSTNTLFKRADHYMYRAKAKGKNTVVYGEDNPTHAPC